ncbi:hypothetical protein M501DRAFT_1013381 [Patellaria atrata CBS 101060]|uniref:NB-ARC domain-containing protein n=1 Tax=Patellaria atrata CBS 101060 TaxID=1346257 RepID=A0A9P4VTZ9_9PEZI|nr:hypothetical protein M501DRAFT_1013381 [Patellaria atrata CBS 101060]
MKKVLREFVIVESGGTQDLLGDMNDEIAKEIMDLGKSLSRDSNIPSITFYEKGESPVKKSRFGTKRRLLVSESMASIGRGKSFDTPEDHINVARLEHDLFEKLKLEMKNTTTRYINDLTIADGLTANQDKTEVEKQSSFVPRLQGRDIPWLLVFDNVNDLSTLAEFWPTGNTGSVLITSRDHTSSTLTLVEASEKIQGLRAEKAIDLVQNLLGRAQVSEEEREELSTIVEKVEHLPLALQSIARTMLKMKCSVHDFAMQCAELQDIIEDSGPRHFNRPTSRYEHCLQTVWRSSLMTLDHSTRKLLEAICFLDPDGIQEKLLRATVK